MSYNNCVFKTFNAGDVSSIASHIMMVEGIDKENGMLRVIEGNANENVYINSKKVVVQNSKQGRNGGQLIGEFQETNKRDGLIRKDYSIEDLILNGYSGYIDNSGIV